jgi:uncharacterized membrane protein YeaQ/YmgE (transglycosylase-associated protein family)
MSFAVWVVLGLVAGFVASKLVNKTGEGMLLDILVAYHTLTNRRV